MCIKHYILSLILFASLTTQAGVVKAVHLPMGNDRFSKWQTEWLAPGAAGDSAVWDFSQAIVTDEHHRVMYLAFGDTALVRFEGGGQYIYSISGDTVLWLGYENPTTKAVDSIPPLVMRFPMNYGDSIVTPLYFSGDYCGNNALALKGVYHLSADGRGTLILPDDTVPDVIRLRIEYTAKVKIDRDMDMTPISENDTLMTKTVTAWRWYSSYYRYPLAESILSVYLDPQGNEARRHEVSYIFTPDAQEYALENSPRRMLANMQGYGTGGGHLPGLGNDTTGGSLENLSASYSGTAVMLDYDISGENVQTEAVLTDLQGRVYGSIARHNAESGHQSERMQCGVLPVGDYLLSVNVNGERSTHLLRVR